VRAGRHGVDDYLTLAAGFGRERASGIVSEIAMRLTFVHDYLTTDRSRPVYERFVQTLFRPAFEELGINAATMEDDDRRALRASVIDALGRAGNDAALSAAARDALDRSLTGGAPLDPSAAGAIVSVAARHGDAALWERLLNASKDAPTPAEQSRYRRGLAAFTDPRLVDRGLSLALSADLRSQDTPSFLAAFIANPVARPRAWSFIRQHWAELAPKITIALGDARLIDSLGAFCDRSAREDIKAFFTAHKLPAASRTLDRTLERINTCISISNRQRPVLSQWLAERDTGSGLY
jgi:aminopeptidase N